jgi:hypothetical protein
MAWGERVDEDSAIEEIDCFVKIEKDREKVEINQSACIFLCPSVIEERVFTKFPTSRKKMTASGNLTIRSLKKIEKDREKVKIEKTAAFAKKSRWMALRPDVGNTVNTCSPSNLFDQNIRTYHLC